MLKAAEPSDMLIVCSEYSLQIKPESSSVEEEVVLFLDRITNFPGYATGTEEDTGANLKGPYAGGDIAVYHLTRESLELLKSKMDKEKLWPACLPKKEYAENRGIFGGWLGFVLRAWVGSAQEPSGNLILCSVPSFVLCMFHATV